MKRYNCDEKRIGIHYEDLTTLSANIAEDFEFSKAFGDFERKQEHASHFRGSCFSLLRKRVNATSL